MGDHLSVERNGYVDSPARRMNNTDEFHQGGVGRESGGAQISRRHAVTLAAALALTVPIGSRLLGSAGAAVNSYAGTGIANPFDITAGPDGRTVSMPTAISATA